MAYDIKVFRTHIEISPYKLGDNLDFEKNMSTYDKTLHKWNPLCYHVEDDILYIPKGISIKSIEKYFYSSPVPVYAPDDYDTIESGEGLYPRRISYKKMQLSSYVQKITIRIQDDILS